MCESNEIWRDIPGAMQFSSATADFWRLSYMDNFSL